MIPLSFHSGNLYNQIEERGEHREGDQNNPPVYGSTSFIYKLISSNPHETPTLPLPPDYSAHPLPPPYQRSLHTLSPPAQPYQGGPQYREHRRELSSPSRHLLAGPPGLPPTIHQRSKSSPYNGFVV